ncbi:MAG: ABC-F family ATP-binding cassette domain-containing protein [Bacteroidota bacterium]|nr:ABC-F family ATP-binding cassette domain-containing protein [Candidatus Kapabacteria bacterium]MDW8218900.1 ABC-F family ATP-binding cassette domain-containing protein [Bacteroidota bacterium]
MLRVSSLSVHFGGTCLLDNVSFMIGNRDRVGVIGKNGAGKSTLLRILAGIQQPEQGEVHTAHGYTIGYLPQEGCTSHGRTVYDETATAFSHIQELEERVQRIAADLEHRHDYDSAQYLERIRELADTQDRLDRLGASSIHGEIERVLQGLGFSQADMVRMTDELSGGWQMRIELAKILLQKPHCILLDEPTNHLDIESLLWLEHMLQNYDGAVVLVSHDRRFLDTVTTRTLELSLGKVYDYPVPYSQYVEMRRERQEQQRAAYMQQQRYITDTERFIERFRYKATKAAQVQSRIKHLQKLERIELEPEDTSSIHVQFPEAPRSGRVVVEAQGVVKEFGQERILDSVDFVLERGEKVAFVGRNGEGKTTFSKILAGYEPVTAGRVHVGYNVKIGYYAQHQAELLDPHATVLEILDRAATGEIRTKIRDILGAFLFSGDMVHKKVKILSGGEKSRLALAKLLVEPVNMLVLDEPTNHLDMRAKDVLKQALINYQGAMIVVSHDRDFLQGLTTKVVELRGGKIREFFGDIHEFLCSKDIDTLQHLEYRSNIHAAETTNIQEKSANAIDREERKRLQKEERRLARQIQACEEIITTLEQAIALLETQMAEAEFYTKPNMQEIIAEFEAKRKELDAQMEQWSMLSEEYNRIAALCSTA